MKDRYLKLKNELNHTNTLFIHHTLTDELRALSLILSGRQLKINFKANGKDN